MLTSDSQTAVFQAIKIEFLLLLCSVADKDALTNELNKVQQANRQLTNELKNSLEMIKQKDAHLKTMEDKLRHQQNSKVQYCFYEH